MTKIKEGKRRFNYVDVIILLLVVAAGFVGYRFLGETSLVASEVPEVSFTVEIKNCPPDYKTRIHEGDAIKDAIKGGAYGKVTGISVTPNIEYMEDKINGEFVQTSHEGREDVYVTITGTPTTYGKNIMFASQTIKVGKQVNIKGKDYVGTGFVVDMQVIE